MRECQDSTRPLSMNRSPLNRSIACPAPELYEIQRVHLRLLKVLIAFRDDRRIGNDIESEEAFSKID